MSAWTLKVFKMHTINDVVILNNCIDRLGRVYDPVELIMESVTKAPLYGELEPDHSPDVNLERVSHVVKNLRLEHNCLVGDFELLDTPMGMIAKQLVEHEIPLKTHIRVFGDVDNNTVKNLSLIAIDFVKDV